MAKKKNIALGKGVAALFGNLQEEVLKKKKKLYLKRF